MIKWKVVAALAVIGPLLGGCPDKEDLKPTVVREVLIQAPANLFKCPGAPKKPAFETMTDAEIATYVNRLYNARSVCAKSLNAIENYENRAAAKKN